MYGRSRVRMLSFSEFFSPHLLFCFYFCLLSGKSGRIMRSFGKVLDGQNCILLRSFGLPGIYKLKCRLFWSSFWFTGNSQYRLYIYIFFRKDVSCILLFFNRKKIGQKSPSCNMNSSNVIKEMTSVVCVSGS